MKRTKKKKNKKKKMKRTRFYLILSREDAVYAFFLTSPISYFLGTSVLSFFDFLFAISAEKMRGLFTLKPTKKVNICV